MAGPLQSAGGLAPQLLPFILPHVAVLLLLGSLGYGPHPQVVVRISALVVIGLTLLFPFLISAATGILVLAGIAAAPLAIHAAAGLGAASRPQTAAATGLIAGNLLLLVLVRGQLAPPFQALLIALPLALPLVAPGSFATDVPGGLGGLSASLPTLFLFQLVAGVMYGYILPSYDTVAWYPGLELLCYILAVAAGALFRPARCNRLFLWGILFATMALPLLHDLRSPLVNLSMFLMQAAAGCIDVFILVFLLRFPARERAFGLGLGITCLGIAGGYLAARALSDLSMLLILSVSAILNLAMLVQVIFSSRRRRDEEHGAEIAPAAVPLAAIPQTIRILLSEREIEVVRQIMEGKNYRQTAEAIGVSESSVKTYMQRIYGKIGVSGKAALLERLVARSEIEIGGEGQEEPASASTSQIG